jgi:hypothetical protein
VTIHLVSPGASSSGNGEKSGGRAPKRKVRFRPLAAIESGAWPRASPACFSYRFCVTLFPSVVRGKGDSLDFTHLEHINAEPLMSAVGESGHSN